MKISHMDHFNLYGSRATMEEAKAFYIDVLGFTEGFRPDFGIEGNWLYWGELPLVHLTVTSEKIENKRSQASQTGPIHHVALRCEGLTGFRTMLKEKNIAYEVGNVPELNLTQLFIHDPLGVCIELNFCDGK